MKTITRIFLTLGLMAALMVGGCGSNNNDDQVATTPAPSTSVPGSAGASANAFIAFLTTLNPNDETSEPLTLCNSFAVPDEDTGESQPLV